jgi:hypothetical protein
MDHRLFKDDVSNAEHLQCPVSEMMEAMQDGAAVHFKETCHNLSNELRKTTERRGRADAPAEIRTGSLLNKRHKCTRSSETQQIFGKKYDGTFPWEMSITKEGKRIRFYLYFTLTCS